MIRIFNCFRNIKWPTAFPGGKSAITNRVQTKNVLNKSPPLPGTQTSGL